MKLAIVIVHYNTCADLQRCLSSLRDHPPTCEHAVIVVDNASTDPDLAALAARFPGVRWIHNRENMGYAKGANIGLAAVAADFYLVLNPDIMAEPGAVDAVLAFAEAHPQAGIVGPQLLNPDGTIQDSCRRFYTFGTLLLRRTFFGRLFPRSRTVQRHLMRDFDHRSQRPVDWVLGGCLLVRAAALARTGPMDERFFLYFEDVDWCYRMWQAGWEVRYTPSARFVHRHRRDSARGAFSRGFWLHLGSLISFYEKWGMLVYLLKRWRGPLVVCLRWVVDMVALWVAFLGAYALRWLGNPFFQQPLYPLREYRPLMLFGTLLATATFLAAGRYRGSGRRVAPSPGKHLQQVGTVSLLLLASSFIGRQEAVSRAVLLLFIPLLVLCSALGADLFAALRNRLERGYLSLARTLLVGDPRVLGSWLEGVGDPRRVGVDPVGFVCERAPADRPEKPRIGERELPWLGRGADLVATVLKYRISQVVFWDLPRPDRPEYAALLGLCRHRIRLRWRTDDLWLLAAGARSESFGGQLSGVLEPSGASFLGWLGYRLLDLGGAFLLAAASLLPYLWLVTVSTRRGRAQIREVSCRDGFQRELVLRLACTPDGRVLPLWWQWTLVGPLLSGRLGLFGPRLVLAAGPPAALTPTRLASLCRQGLQRPGLTGGWSAREPAPTTAVPAGAPASPEGPLADGATDWTLCGRRSWRLVGRMCFSLLLNPGGFGRVPGRIDSATPGSPDPRSSREVS